MKLLIIFFSLASLVFASIGEIKAINGSADIVRGFSKVKARLGSKIEKKDIIQTHSGAKLQIVFNDNTVISLGQKTDFKIDDYLFTPTDVKAHFSVSKGIFKSITGRIGKIDKSKFKLRTNNATIGVRGTTFIGKVESDKEMIACTSGEIVIETSHGVVNVKKGGMTTLFKNQKPTAVKKIDKKKLEVFEKITESVQEVSNNSAKVSSNTNKGKAVVANVFTSSSDKKVSKKASKIVKKIAKNFKSNFNKYSRHNKYNIPRSSDTKSIIDKVTDGTVSIDYGEWDDPVDTIEHEQASLDPVEVTNGYNDLIAKAGSSIPTYSGKVKGNIEGIYSGTKYAIKDDSHNQINLNFDLATASVSGRVKFKTEARFSKNWNTNISGTVGSDGKFAFNPTSSHYRGAGTGELNGDNLESATGELDIKKGFYKTDATFDIAKD